MDLYVVTTTSSFWGETQTDEQMVVDRDKALRFAEAESERPDTCWVSVVLQRPNDDGFFVPVDLDVGWYAGPKANEG